MKNKFWIFLSGLIILASIFASNFPDGLERAAIDLGFINKAQSIQIDIHPILQGFLGILLIYLIFTFVKVIISRKDKKHPTSRGKEANL